PIRTPPTARRTTRAVWTRILGQAATTRTPSRRTGTGSASPASPSAGSSHPTRAWARTPRRTWWPAAPATRTAPPRVQRCTSWTRKPMSPMTRRTNRRQAPATPGPGAGQPTESSSPGTGCDSVALVLREVVQRLADDLEGDAGVITLARQESREPTGLHLTVQPA